MNPSSDFSRPIVPAYPRRERERRARMRRRRRGAALVAILAAAALVAALVTAGGSTSRHAVARTPLRSARPLAAHPAVSVAPRPHPVHHRPPPDPGSLPQTEKLPPSDSAGFHAEMAALWRGVAGDSLHDALPAFFPEGAYAQVKAIYSPRADYTERLERNYGLDIDAAHAFLGSEAAHAKLVRVDAPSVDAHWVPPGACYNAVGYFELAGARMVYREGAVVRSLGIASLISWRGVWYVIHLGSVDQAGVLDDPEAGPGTPAPTGTC